MARRHTQAKKFTLTAAFSRPWWTALQTLLFFLTVGFCGYASIKTTALALMVLALGVGALRFSALREQVRLPFLALLLVVAMAGISTTYALSGKFALHEFLKLVTGFCAPFLLILVLPGEGTSAGRKVATVLEGGAALFSLLSVDHISTRLISEPFLSLFHYNPNMDGLEPGIRMIGIFENANILAGCVGIGILLALGLAVTAENNRERCVHLCCLYINALAFVLAFSMGATAAIAAAFLILLLMEHRERRGGMFVLMLETLILTMVGVSLTAMTSFTAWEGLRPVPLLCLAAGSALLCLADLKVGQKLAGILATRSKALLVSVAVLFVLLGVFALAAYNMTGPATLNPGQSLRRSAYPAPGEYTMSVQGDDRVNVTVTSQNQQDTMMHTSTVLYRGPIQQAVFTVPQDSVVVYFTMSHSGDGDSVLLEAVSYSGTAGSGTLPLKYTLLPEFIANRLQGLKANQNAIQRLVFFEDGMKLFAKSPVIGCGIGSFENAIYGVQSFYYETKYVHNHYIQTMLETGLIGLVFFVGLLGLSGAAVVLSRRKEEFHPLTPALGAALAFMAIHGAIEVVFSAFPYLPLAFGVFLLINLCCGESLPGLGKKIRIGILAAAALLMVVFGYTLYSNMSAKALTERERTFDSLNAAVSMDRYEWADYALSYVVSSMDETMPDYVKKQAAVYAKQLGEVNSNTIPLYLTDYYLFLGNEAEAMRMAEKYVTYCAANSETWNTILNTISVYESDSETYRAGVARIWELLTVWEEENMGTIQLDEYSRAFLEEVLG